MSNEFDDTEDLDAPWRDHRDELLERVTRRGKALRVRRQVVLVSVVSAILVMPFAAVAATKTQTDVPVLRWASRVSSESAAPTSTTTSTIATVSSTTANTTVPGRTVLTQPVLPGTAATTTTVTACRNSVDPACGQFRWDPAPPAVNAIPIGVLAINGQPGADVAIGIDLDVPALLDIDYGDGTTETRLVAPEPCPGTPAGPWSWPTLAGAEVAPLQHTYVAEGSYSVTVIARPVEFCGHASPYTDGVAGGIATISLEPPTTTSTTTPAGP
jgi:hypothetical protein